MPGHFALYPHYESVAHIKRFCNLLDSSMLRGSLPVYHLVHREENQLCERSEFNLFNHFFCCQPRTAQATFTTALPWPHCYKYWWRWYYSKHFNQLWTVHECCLPVATHPHLVVEEYCQVRVDEFGRDLHCVQRVFAGLPRMLIRLQEKKAFTGVIFSKFY